jgi:DNA-binding Xre family transcriptional regulator
MSQICRGSRAKAITAAELARHAGISYATIRDLIHNRTARVDFATLARLM